MVHLQTTIQHRLSSMTRLTVEIGRVDGRMTVGTVPGNSRCGCMMHHSPAVYQWLIRVAGSAVEFGLIDAMTGSTIIGQTRRRNIVVPC